MPLEIQPMPIIYSYAQILSYLFQRFRGLERPLDLAILRWRFGSAVAVSVAALLRRR